MHDPLTHEGSPEPVSPELVLVDPELRQRLAALPEAPLFVLPPATVRRPAPAVAERRRSRTMTAALVLALLAGAAAGIGVEHLASPLLAGGSSIAADVAVPAEPTLPPPSPPTTTAPPTAAAAPRSFAWAPVPGAAAYAFELRRGGDIAFTTTTKAPTVRLPVLIPGNYRWIVWPLVGGRDAQHRGPAVVNAQLHVDG